MKKMNEAAGLEARKSDINPPAEEIKRAQTLLIERMRSPLTSLDAAIQQMKTVQENLMPLASEVERVQGRLSEYPKLFEDIQRTREELQEKKIRLQQELEAAQGANSDSLLYVALELQEAEATEHRAIALVDRYAREQEDMQATLSHIIPKKEFLQEQQERVRQTIVARTDSLRQDFKTALAAPPLSEVLPSTYTKELDDILVSMRPHRQTKYPGILLEAFRSALHKDITPKPPPAERRSPSPRRSREKKENLQTRVRAMIKRDISEVLQIEQLSFEYAWTEEDFLRKLKPRNCGGQVSVHGEKVVGFMIAERRKSRLHILNFAVHPSFRKKDVGSQMIDKLISELSSHRCTRISLELRETNMIAQRFFQQNGFKATKVLHDCYEDTSEDAYLMEYKIEDVEDEEEETEEASSQDDSL